MRRISRGRLAFAFVTAVAIAGCADEVPTLTDTDRIPGSLEPVTIAYTLQANEFLNELIVLRGETDVSDSDDLIVAGAFDGLDAHVLAEFSAFPDTINYENSANHEFAFVSGLVRSAIPDTLAASADVLTFYLWEVVEDWDSTATWTEATSRPVSRPWQQVGGTRGELLAVAEWERSNSTASADSLEWELPLDAILRLAEDPEPGLMVTLDDQSARSPISALSIQLSLEPAANPDTVVTRNVSSIRQQFIYSNVEPTPGDLLRVGGVTSDRTLLRIQLPDMLPGCPSGACSPVTLADVTLNRVDLFLDPVPVTNGFRPVGPMTIRARQLLEPVLGAQAPLGQVVAQDTVTATAFAGGNPGSFGFVITAFVGQEIVSTAIEDRCGEGVNWCPAELGLAIIVEPEASTFPFAWFDRTPTLRFIYTLRQTPGRP